MVGVIGIKKSDSTLHMRDQFLDEFNDPNAFYGNAQQHVDNFEAGGGLTQADQIFMLNL
ncbi:hypothetical protein RHGRI_031614 [Rhododendron griersonianum]|uniref:Uncharacterized protein n=1 Tax=Rhododendron griersonianum TaxID=479676 RepID=A0AAV6I8Z7_9ERIC|nr:hypothetical protein RHGRI_031614 [Rhododendron griersonianum]